MYRCCSLCQCTRAHKKRRRNSSLDLFQHRLSGKIEKETQRPLLAILRCRRNTRRIWTHRSTVQGDGPSVQPLRCPCQTRPAWGLGYRAEAEENLGQMKDSTRFPSYYPLGDFRHHLLGQIEVSVLLKKHIGSLVLDSFMPYIAWDIRLPGFCTDSGSVLKQSIGPKALQIIWNPNGYQTAGFHAHRRPFHRLVCIEIDGFHWFRLALFHLPGKPKSRQCSCMNSIYWASILGYLFL